MNSDQEIRRLAALKKYNILDTLTEKDYEDITFLASTICEVPIALISFVDEKRQWFKSHAGLEISETPRELSFCEHAIKDSRDVMIVEDSRLDDRFRNNPFVTGDPRIVFYAGIPLINEEGYGLGTVCILDTRVRTLRPEQLEALKVLSKQVMHLLELRRINYELEGLKLQLETRNRDLEQFAMVVSHDIKSPLTSVLLANDLLKSDFSEALGSEGQELVSISNNAVTKIKSLVDGILAYYNREAEAGDDHAIDMAPFFESFKKSLHSTKRWTLAYNLNGVHSIHFNRTQLEQIFLNLISNSIRYNEQETVCMEVDVTETGREYAFSVADNGIGIPEEDHEKIFHLFTTVSEQDHFGLRGTGIGLSTVKRIVESAGGTIRVSSKPGEGTTFLFTLAKPGD